MHARTSVPLFVTQGQGERKRLEHLAALKGIDRTVQW